MHIGTVIKLERLRRKMKLETLAKGICSVAHLSRIENGYNEPSEEIIDMLSDRLGIPLKNNEHAATNHKPPMQLNEIRDQSIAIINNRDQEGALQFVNQLSKYVNTENLDTQLKVDIELLILRLLLLEKSNSKIVLHEVERFKKVEETLTLLQRFRMNMIAGMASYGCGDAKSSLEALTNAFRLLDVAPVLSFERADFSYVYAVALMAESQKFGAYERAKYALNYFKHEMASKRAVECLLICGITSKQMGQIEKALNHLHEAKRICKQFNMEGFFGIVYQNLGDAYSVKGNLDSAIAYFKKAFSVKKQPDEMIYTVLSLVDTYLKAEMPKEVNYWIQEGYRIIPKLSETKRVIFEKHFNVYHAIYLKDDRKIESELIKAVEFFKHKNRQKQMKEYAKKLADFYAEKRRYKSAVNYYKVLGD